MTSYSGGGGGGGGGGGTMIPLPRTAIVAQGTSVPLASQNGSFGLPFETMAQAIAALTALGGTDACQIIVFPGNYSSEGILNWGPAAQLLIQSLYPAAPFGNTIALDEITSAGPVSVSGAFYINKITCAGPIHLDSGCALAECDCPGAVTLNSASLNGGPYQCSQMVARDSWIGFGNYVISGVGAIVEMLNCTTFTAFPPNFDFLGGGTLKMDSLSAYEFARVGGTVNSGVRVLRGAEVVDNGLSGIYSLIDFSSPYQSIDIDDTVNLEFVPPLAPCHCQLRLNMLGAHVITFIDPIAFASAPVPSSSGYDILSLFWDGTGWTGIYTAGF